LVWWGRGRMGHFDRRSDGVMLDISSCNYSPAAAEKAVTVGASTLGDLKAYFSNDGPCVVSDILACRSSKFQTHLI
jgi:hypothetical protein